MDWWQIALIGLAGGVVGVVVTLYTWHAIQDVSGKITEMLMEIDQQGYERGLAEGLERAKQQGTEPESH